MSEQGSRVVVDLAALGRNWQALRQRVAPAACGAVVKADAYGLGAVAVGKTLADLGCQHFFVATAAEGGALRQAVGSGPQIYTLHGVIPDQVEVHLSSSLTPVLATSRDVALWQARGQGRACWIQVDTGMNRLGFGVDDLFGLPDLAGLTITGVLSHLACADEPEQFLNVEQIRAFRALRSRFPASRGSGSVLGSLANSAGIFLDPACHADIARPGYALYGGNGMEAVVHWSAPVLQVRTLREGDSVGYGALWRATAPTRVATLEVGYSEGLPRSLSPGRGVVFFEGSPAPIIGRVSMDLITVDVTALDPAVVTPGTRAEILGPHQTLDQLAAAAGTIGYEILTGLNPRGGIHYTPCF